MDHRASPWALFMDIRGLKLAVYLRYSWYMHSLTLYLPPDLFIRSCRRRRRCWTRFCGYDGDSAAVNSCMDQGVMMCFLEPGWE